MLQCVLYTRKVNNSNISVKYIENVPLNENPQELCILRFKLGFMISEILSFEFSWIRRTQQCNKS